MKRRIILPCIIVMLIGCTPAQRQAMAINNSIKTAATEQKACLDKLRASSDFDVLREHIPEYINDATLEQLSDDNKVTDDEIDALYYFYPKFKGCKEASINRLIETAPTIASLRLEQMRKEDEILVKLVKRRITWGEYNQEKKEIFSATLQDGTSEMQNIGNNLKEQNDEQMQQIGDAINQIGQSIPSRSH